MKSPLCAGLAAALIAAAPLTFAAERDPPPSPAPTLATRFEQGRQHLEAGRHAQAYATFARLADEGHAESARLALQMRQAGPRRHGSNFMAGPKQLERWRAVLLREAAPSALRPAMPANSVRPAAQPADADREIWRHQGVG